METVDGQDISHLLAGESGAVHKVGVTTRPKTVLPHQVIDTGQGTTCYRNSVNRDGKIHPDRLRRLERINYL